MNDKAIAKADADLDPFSDLNLSVIERAVTMGDLSKLQPDERFQLYLDVCRSLGLNPTTQPFAYFRLSGQLKLYARKDCAEQLRFKYRISIELEDPKKQGDVWMQKAKATMPNGRHDESIGAVSVGSATRGDALANAIMKCETKAKRRVTLSICGLGFVPDESELATMGQVEYVKKEDVEQALPTKSSKRLAPENDGDVPLQERSSPELPKDVLEDAQPYTEEAVGFVPADSAPTEPPPPTSPSPPSVPDASFQEQPPAETEDSLAKAYCKAMAAALSVSELKNLQLKIMELQFEDGEMEVMKAAYLSRKKELKEGE